MDDCILWDGYINRKGYGTVYVGNRLVRVHKKEWEEAYGPVPEGMDVHHICEVKACRNLDHLELKTHSEHGKHHNQTAKFTEETAVYVMARLLTGESQRSVARAFGVTQAAVSYLWRGYSWRHLFEEVCHH